MSAILGIVAAAAGWFAGTNVDYFVVPTALFASSRATGRPKPWQIWGGQYAGVAALVAVSEAAAVGLANIPRVWVGLLGLVPLTLGLRRLVRALRARDQEDPAQAAPAAGLASVVGVTIANGGDNIAVYAPAFRVIGAGGTAITVAVFAAGIALWCLAGSRLVAHRSVIAAVQRCGGGGATCAVHGPPPHHRSPPDPPGSGYHPGGGRCTPGGRTGMTEGGTGRSDSTSAATQPTRDQPRSRLSAKIVPMRPTPRLEPMRVGRK